MSERLAIEQVSKAYKGKIWALWDDFKEDRCLDAQCYNGKLAEHIRRRFRVIPI